MVKNGHSQAATIVSIGYQQRSVAELVEELTRAQVKVLVDVRLNPISRRKGFSKTALSEILFEAGIEYRHERELGNPRDNREAFRKGHNSARRRYVRHLENGAGSAYLAVIDLAHRTRIALLCYERDHKECHRSSILDRATRDDPTVNIVTI